MIKKIFIWLGLLLVNAGLLLLSSFLPLTRVLSPGLGVIVLVLAGILSLLFVLKGYRKIYLYLNVALLIIYFLLVTLPIGYAYCGGGPAGWSGAPPDCKCIGVRGDFRTKSGGFPFFGGNANQCIGVRTQCFALSGDAYLRQDDMKNDQNTPVEEVLNFLKQRHSALPNSTGEFQITKINQTEDFVHGNCSGGQCTYATTTNHYYFKYNVGVDCRNYDEKIQTTWLK